MKRILLSLLFLLSVTSIFADEPYRVHRYDGFKALPVKKGDWVFVGNSITHMHEWREALGGDKRVKNRGVSGGMTHEVLANIDEFVSGQPAKVFLGIGVNDLHGGVTPETASDNVRKTIARIKEISPKTRIFVSNVHPTNYTSEEIRTKYNALLKQICEEKGATFISTDDVLQPVKTDKTYSFDGLHLTSKGYKFWLQKIAEADPDIKKVVYKGMTTEQIDENIRDIFNGTSSNSYGMRLSYFSHLPVKKSDILFVGDELLHGTEMAELLCSNKVKNRGTGWGYPGPELDLTLKSIPFILHDGARPAQIFLYSGACEIAGNDKDNLDMVKEKYQQVVEKILELSPKTKITLMALLPTTERARNINKVKPFNDWLSAFATDQGLRFIDTYTPFTESEVLNPRYASTLYLNAEGYRLLAKIL